MISEIEASILYEDNCRHWLLVELHSRPAQYDIPCGIYYSDNAEFEEITDWTYCFRINQFVYIISPGIWRNYADRVIRILFKKSPAFEGVL